MTHPEALARPSAGRILSHPFLRANSPRGRTNRELAKELASAKQRLKQLEMQLALQKFNATSAATVTTTATAAAACPESKSESGLAPVLKVGRGARKSASCYQLPAHKE